MRIPATTANMGPGFDCIGMAFDLYNYISYETVAEEGYCELSSDGDAGKIEMCIRDRGYSTASGIPYAIGLIKNKYIGRTFISPEQSSRMDRVKIKLSVIEEIVRGKRVILVEMCIRDSIIAMAVTFHYCQWRVQCHPENQIGELA